eukprot:g9083.t1
MIEESLQENPTCQPGFGVSGDGINTAKTCTKCLKNTYSVGGVNAKCVACPSSRPYTYENFKTFTSIDSCHSNDNYHFCEAGKSGEHVITDTVPIRSSGQCTAYITNEADCKEAAKANNINIQHFEKRDDQYRPKGCYYNNGNRLTFNSRSSSTRNCRYWQRCLCKTEKHCKNCPKNTYSLGGHNSTCVACPSDKPTTNFTTGQSSCMRVPPITCKPGFGVSGDGINTTKTCTKCLKNTYSDGGVDPSCLGATEYARKLESRYCKGKETVISPAIPMSDKDDGVKCIKMNRDNIVNSYCAFQQEFDRTLQDYNISRRSRDFWPHICCSDDCLAPPGIEQINMIPFSKVHDVNVTKEASWQEVYNLLHYNNDNERHSGHVYGGMLKALTILATEDGDVVKMKKRLKTMFKKMNLCGPRVFRSLSNDEIQMCQLFHAYNHMFNSFHTHFKNILSKKDLVALVPVLDTSSVKRRQLLSQNDDNLCKGISTYTSCDSLRRSMTEKIFYPPSKNFVHVKNVQYVEVPKNCKVTLYSKVNVGGVNYGAKESVSITLHGPHQFCVTDSLPMVAGIKVENHIDEAEYIKELVSTEMKRFKNKPTVGATGRQGLRGPKGNDGNVGPRGATGERGNDGTGLKLKRFALGNIYHHGDYVFSKSSKDNHDSMYIAENTFIASKTPHMDLDSGNWVEFHAPRGLDGEIGATGATGAPGIGLKGATGPRGPPGVVTEDMIEKVGTPRINRLQSAINSLKLQVARLDAEDSSTCPSIKFGADPLSMEYQTKLHEHKEKYCDEYNLDLSTPNNINVAMIYLDKDIGDRGERFKRAFAATAKFKVTDRCKKPLFFPKDISVQRIEGEWVLIVQFSGKSGYLQYELNDKCDSRSYMPTTEIGLQIFSDTKNCCAGTKDAQQCFESGCTVTQLNKHWVDEPLSFKVSVIGNVFQVAHNNDE